MIFQCFISNKCRLDEHMILISKTLKIVGFLSKRLTSTVHSLINIIDSVFFFFCVLRSYASPRQIANVCKQNT